MPSRESDSRQVHNFRGIISGMHIPDAFAVLDPKGTISLAERGLMIHAVEFMLIVAIPVYLLLFFFAWRYGLATQRQNTCPSGSTARWRS